MEEGEFANWLREQMTRRKLSQSSLGLYTGISQSAISKWLKGGPPPSAPMVERLAQYFGESVTKALALAGHPHSDADKGTDPHLPGWLTEELVLLTEDEWAIVRAVALAIREAREARQSRETEGAEQ